MPEITKQALQTILRRLLAKHPHGYRRPAELAVDVFIELGYAGWTDPRIFGVQVHELCTQALQEVKREH